jgi:hypothetical protein
MQTIWNRQRIAVPLCEKHWYFARLYPIFGLGWPVCFLAFSQMTLWRKSILQLADPVLFDVVSMLCCLAWILIALLTVAAGYGDIRALKITEGYVELTNVAQKFVEAVEVETNFRQLIARESGERFGQSSPADDRLRAGGEQRIQPGGDEVQAG